MAAVVITCSRCGKLTRFTVDQVVSELTSRYLCARCRHVQELQSADSERRERVRRQRAKHGGEIPGQPRKRSVLRARRAGRKGGDDAA